MVLESFFMHTRVLTSAYYCNGCITASYRSKRAAHVHCSVLFFLVFNHRALTPRMNEASAFRPYTSPHASSVGQDTRIRQIDRQRGRNARHTHTHVSVRPAILHDIPSQAGRQAGRQTPQWHDIEIHIFKALAWYVRTQKSHIEAGKENTHTHTQGRQLKASTHQSV